MQTLFAKSKDLVKMKDGGNNARKYSIQQLDTLVSFIKIDYELNEEDISKKVGYNEGYISQTRSRGEVTNKFIEALQREFKDPKTNMVYTLSASPKTGALIAMPDPKDQMIATLQDTIKHLLETIAELKEQNRKSKGK